MTELNLLGRTIGRFEILSELGRGGMAVVYRARQTDLERIVALKVLPPEFSLDKNYVARFQQEARSAAALEHPHIVPIYEVGSAEGFQYIAMKYIAGSTLKDVVQQQGSLSVQQTTAMLDQAADALDYAHSEGVIHRDIKPSNIMVAQNGWIYLTDFGLARSSATSGLTMAGTVMGTPEYMSPEQAQGLATLGPASDIYSLGIVLYELLTGNMPFHADTPMGMLVARLQYAPRPPRDYRGDLPMSAEDVIMRALARKPEARYATAKEMIEALKQAAGVGARPYTPTQPVSPPRGVAPISPPRGLPPTQAIQTPTPQYVRPAPAVDATVAAPRTATPLATPAARAAIGAPGGGIPATPIGGQAARSGRPGRGLLIGAVVAVLLLVLGGAFAWFQLREDPRIQQGIKDGQAALNQTGGMDKAIGAYQQTLAADPQNATAHTQLALIYNLRSRYTDAEKEARAAIKTDPKNALALAMLAEALNDLDDRAGASDAADKAVAADSKASAGYSARAAIRADAAEQNSDPDLLKQAVADADKALELSFAEPNLSRALAHSARGYVYWQQYLMNNDNDAVKRGVEEFNQAIGLQNQFAVFHSNLGYFYNAQGEYDQAKEKFEAALAADDQYGHAHTGLGWNLYYLKDYNGAQEEFDKAIESNSQDVDAYVGKSRALQYQDSPDYDAAIDTLNKAAEAAPKRPIIFSNLGWAYVNKAAGQEYASDGQKSDYDEAESQFRKALDLNEKYIDALTGLGWTLRDQAEVLKDDSKNQDAIDAVEKSIQIKESQPYAHYTLGWSYYDLKQYDKAETAFRRSTELSDTYADAYYGLGRALEALGKKDEARQAYQTALDNGSPYAQDALDRLK